MCEVVSLASKRGPLIIGETILGLPVYAFSAAVDTVFANVLNVADSQDMWPGNAAEMVSPELFARRLSDPSMYEDNSNIAEHLRCETLRRCDTSFFGTADYFNDDLDRYVSGASFAKDASLTGVELFDKLDLFYGDDGDDGLFSEDLNY